jgi:hypothetical protein
MISATAAVRAAFKVFRSAPAPWRDDKVVEKTTKLGATVQGPVMDMFWGDRCGTVVDPDGNNWMVGTHKAGPSAKEIKKALEEMMKQRPAATAAAD